MYLTVRHPVRFKGVGLHSGQPVRIKVAPAPRGHGIAFLRTDIGAETGLVEARYDAVCDTRLCTRIGNAHGATIGTIEHLMAALAGSGISDALVEIDGPEVPIMDGSARAFVAGLARAGLHELGGRRAAIRIDRPVEVVQGDKRARLVPASTFGMRFAIDFADPAIGRQSAAFALTGGAVIDKLADCRTFGMLSEVEALRRMNLARGGSLANAIVIDQGRVLNPEGLRRPDEFVRHKMLDAVGDLALAGAPILGRYEAERAGHEMTNLLLRALFAAPGAWSWTELDPWQGLDLRAARHDTAARAEPVAV
ncbi:MAG: UDP-3-O-acyl-N-acetylglucosamine deacetylase [Thermohalobaculum sp.]|nr:UDP-3-O-acyl-N-acetylglucosamine deacetylase [Thermohalobaculum sp.]